MTVLEHKLNIVQLLEELSEESLIELEKMITRLKANQKNKKRRQPSALIAGKAKVVGDLIASPVEIGDIECLK